MLDPDTEVGDYPELGNLLRACKPVVKSFYEAEREAFKYQTNYRWNAKWAARLGTGAIVLGVLLLVLMQFGNLPGFSLVRLSLAPVTLIELVVAVAAIVIVTRGQFASDKEKWLLERNRAERCRLLKFSVLTDPEIWIGAKSAISEDKLQRRLRDIQSAELTTLWNWIEKDPPPRCPEPFVNHRVSASALLQLVDYYRKKRLDFQLGWLARTAKRYEEKHRPKSYQFSFLFYASIVAVFLHTVAGLPQLSEELGIHVLPGLVIVGMTALSFIFIFFAVIFPVIGTGLRTSQLADEPARNASRYRAKEYALDELSARLGQAMDAQDPDVVFRELGFCEQVLELDQREWLRLMIEAEWF
jgi:hypothetical protein